MDDRLFLVPSARVLVVLSDARDRLVLQRVDVDELLAKSDADYLLVTSRPPATVTPGKPFSYAPAVRSNKGKVRLRLEGGPEGMTLADGRLTWSVPATFTDPVTVVLAVSDTPGRELFHTFTLGPGSTD